MGSSMGGPWTPSVKDIRDRLLKRGLLGAGERFDLSAEDLVDLVTTLSDLRIIAAQALGTDALEVKRLAQSSQLAQQVFGLQRLLVFIQSGQAVGHLASHEAADTAGTLYRHPAKLELMRISVSAIDLLQCRHRLSAAAASREVENILRNLGEHFGIKETWTAKTIRENWPRQISVRTPPEASNDTPTSDQALGNWIESFLPSPANIDTTKAVISGLLAGPVSSFAQALSGAPRKYLRNY